MSKSGQPPDLKNYMDKSLLALSSYLQDCPREAGNSGIAKPSEVGYQGSSLPGQIDLPQRGYASGHSGDYHSRGYPPNMGPENIRPRGRMNVEEEIAFKLLYQQEKVGSLIGKGGSVIRAIENETGAFIKIADPVPDSDERVVVISAREAWQLSLILVYYYSLESCTILNIVKLNANRLVVGTLRGLDQLMNLVVDNTVEVNGDEKTDIGMVVIRGNSVVTVEALEPVNR